MQAIKAGVAIAGRPWIVNWPSRTPALASSPCRRTKLNISLGSLPASSAAILESSFTGVVVDGRSRSRLINAYVYGSRSYHGGPPHAASWRDSGTRRRNLSTMLMCSRATKPRRFKILSSTVSDAQEVSKLLQGIATFKTISCLRAFQMMFSSLAPG